MLTFRDNKCTYVNFSLAHIQGINLQSTELRRIKKQVSERSTHHHVLADSTCDSSDCKRLVDVIPTARPVLTAMPLYI
jgi:hypothetical protein